MICTCWQWTGHELRVHSRDGKSCTSCFKLFIPSYEVISVAFTKIYKQYAMNFYPSTRQFVEKKYFLRQKKISPAFLIDILPLPFLRLY